ncbi:hypothetical protein TNCV_2244811 [Trichonephila clavipes]|nr:hypothetical protein TNCV_2244811 [Trichonephila clavipes]
MENKQTSILFHAPPPSKSPHLFLIPFPPFVLVPCSTPVQREATWHLSSGFPLVEAMVHGMQKVIFLSTRLPPYSSFFIFGLCERVSLEHVVILYYSSCVAESRWTATAGSDVVQSGRPIFDDFFQHLWPYIGNNTANVVFQMVKRLWLIRIDQ